MTHEVAHIGLYVIFGIVWLPVYVMLVGWFVGKPKDIRSVGLAFGFMVVFFLGIVVSVIALDAALSFVTGA